MATKDEKRNGVNTGCGSPGGGEHALTLTLTNTGTHALTLTHSHTLTLTLTHSHTHSHTHPGSAGTRLTGQVQCPGRDA